MIFTITNFLLQGDYFYYKGEKGIIYQEPVDNPNERKAIEEALWEIHLRGDYTYAENHDDVTPRRKTWLHTILHKDRPY